MSHLGHARRRSTLARAFRGTLVALAVCGARPGVSAAQVEGGIAGAAGGLVAGGYTMTAIYVAEARFGRFLHSYDEMLALRPEILPVVAGGVAGAWLGSESTSALGRAAGWGALGLAGGAVVGAGVGQLIWRTSEGRWAGGIIGSAVGLVAGAVLGGIDGLDDEDATASMPLFAFRIGFGGGG